MDDKALLWVRHKLGDSRPCNLLFLSIRKTETRTTLVKTKIGKVDICDWDLLPQEANISVHLQWLIEYLRLIKSVLDLPWQVTLYW